MTLGSYRRWSAIYYAVALFLIRAEHPDLIDKYREPGSLPQTTFAKLFADIGTDGDVRCAQIEDLLRHGPPVQALPFRAYLRADSVYMLQGSATDTQKTQTATSLL